VTVDEILFRFKQAQVLCCCTDPDNNSCKARFPRDTFIETGINPETGSLNLKKGEAMVKIHSQIWLNLLVEMQYRCDSLLSGTASNPAIAYVTDYITKTPSEDTHNV